MEMPAPDKKPQNVMIKGFALSQHNGQRTYGGPPPNWGNRPPPSRESEVFIGRLPRMCFEDELIPLFSTAGELYEFRLMLDFSGTNRGYGYAHYATSEGAALAIEKFNKYEIRPGHHIGVLKSKNNCRLLFGNIGIPFKVGGFNEFIRSATDQVLKVLIFSSFQQLKTTEFCISPEVEEAFLGRVPRHDGHFAIVEYENHKAAAVARRVLIPKYGHILAIDWAVPPRERKRFLVSNRAVTFDRSLSNPIMTDSNLLTPANTSKIRPVPSLIVQPSLFDNIQFMPKAINNVVKFFKYLLSVCLYKSVDRWEIPLFICKEIEKKIVDRITNLENCSQAVQLIFNYYSWYNEKKSFTISSEVQKLMEEVKVYSDMFVQFVNRKIQYGQLPNPSEENYFINILPHQLNILFRIILRSDGEHQARLSAGISAGLNWLALTMEKNDKATKDFINEIFNLVKNEDSVALDIASSLAKSAFLNAITSSNDYTLPKNFPTDLSSKDSYVGRDLFSGNSFITSTQTSSVEKAVDRNVASRKLALNLSRVSSNTEHNVETDSDPLASSLLAQYKKSDSDFMCNSYPPVPLLLVQPSILNNVPFMPKYFNNVLPYFKHLTMFCLKAHAAQLNISQETSKEIERKIIDRISNMENCVEGVQLIINYVLLWAEKRSCTISLEIQNLLEEVKLFAENFVKYVWNRSLSGYQPNFEMEDYFCHVLPLRLNLLFYMMIILNSEKVNIVFKSISKGLSWLEELIRNGDESSKEFIEELTKFVLEPNPSSFDKVKVLAIVFLSKMVNANHSNGVLELNNCTSLRSPSSLSSSSNASLKQDYYRD